MAKWNNGEQCRKENNFSFLIIFFFTSFNPCTAASAARFRFFSPALVLIQWAFIRSNYSLWCEMEKKCFGKSSENARDTCVVRDACGLLFVAWAGRQYAQSDINLCQLSNKCRWHVAQCTRCWLCSFHELKSEQRILHYFSAYLRIPLESYTLIGHSTCNMNLIWIECVS